MAAVREVAARAGIDVALANHLVMGPAILARALDGRALRGEGPRQRAGVRGQAAPALPPRTRAEGLARRPRRARRLAPHRREPVGGDGRPVAAAPHAARARRASTSSASRPASPAPARAGLERLRDRARRGDRSGGAERLVVRPRHGRGRRRARHGRAGRPARGLRGQADRLQGRRAAAGGLAARARRRAAGAAGDRRVRGVPRGARARLPARSTRAISTPRRRRAARTGGRCRSSTRSSPRLPEGYAPRGLRERVAFAGRLDHDELADLLPAAEAMAVTSTFPEAFGMVAAEAAACGALPVVANHSGLGEVAPHARGRGRAGARLALVRAGPLGSELGAALSGWLPRRTTSRRHARRSSGSPAPATRGTASPAP